MDDIKANIEGNDDAGWRVKEITNCPFKYRRLIQKEVAGKVYRTQKDAIESMAKAVGRAIIADGLKNIPNITIK